MNKTTEALKLAEEALAQPQDKGENNGQRNDNCNKKYSDDNSGNLCSNSDSEASVKPQGEPVAWVKAIESFGFPKLLFSEKHKDGYKPLYTTPPSVESLLKANIALREALEAAIEATIDKVLSCYSPDDTAQDWADKIAAIRSMK